MENVEKYQIKALKKQIFIANLKAWIIGLILIAELLFIGVYFAKSGLLGRAVTTGQKVAVIHYNKEVTEAYTSKIIEQMDRLKKDKSYKEILFVMASPGGSPTASEELSEYLKSYQKEKPITMYVASIAASGGYYIASAVKPLIANKNAIIGSIGVIMPHYNLGELAKKVGITEDYLAAGKYKKPISMFKEIDDENRKYMTEHLLKPTYENFVDAVATNRGLSREAILPFADGKIYIANAPEIKGVLIDQISSFYKIKESLRDKYGKKLEFVKVETEKKYPFLPEVKVDIGLKEIFKNFGMQ